jgi:hypothetical protein
MDERRVSSLGELAFGAVPRVRAKREGDGYVVEGWYMCHVNRTPCPVGDSLKAEDVEHLVVCDGFSDWNMPRGVECHKVDPDTIEVIPW